MNAFRKIRPLFVLLFVASGLLAVQAPSVWAQENGKKHEKVRAVEGITEYSLPNGVRFLLFPDPASSTITVNVNNDSTAGLVIENATVTDSVDGGPATTIASGQTIAGSSVYTWSGPAVLGHHLDTATVTGQIDTSTGACGRDTNGQPISASTQCSSLVECLTPCMLTRS